MEVDGKWLVIDGCNRILAAKLEGCAEVDVKQGHKHDQEMGSYREALKEAIEAKRKGFENMSTGGVGERADVYRQHQTMDVGALKKRLDEIGDSKPDHT